MELARGRDPRRTLAEERTYPPDVAARLFARPTWTRYAHTSARSSSTGPTPTAPRSASRRPSTWPSQNIGYAPPPLKGTLSWLPTRRRISRGSHSQCRCRAKPGAAAGPQYRSGRRRAPPPGTPSARGSAGGQGRAATRRTAPATPASPVPAPRPARPGPQRPRLPPWRRAGRRPGRLRGHTRPAAPLPQQRAGHLSRLSWPVRRATPRQG